MGNNKRSSMAGVRGAKNPIAALHENKSISGEGRAWLTAAVDPFHDFEVANLKGYPDVTTEPTVVVRVQQSLDIVCPVGTQGNWDCHIVLSPVDWAAPNKLIENAPFTPGYNLAAMSLPRGSATYGAGYTQAYYDPDYDVLPCGRIDGCVVNCAPSGLGDASKTWTPTHFPPGDANGYSTRNIVLDEYFDLSPADMGVYRIIYSGFEVINETAAINKQGACTVYEYANSVVPMEYLNPIDPSDVDAVRSKGTANYYRSPPNSLATAKIMPGAQTWEAASGCYCVAKFQNDNPFAAVGSAGYVFQQVDYQSNANSGYITVNNVNNDENTGGSICSPEIGVIFGTTVGDLDNTAPCLPAVHFSRMTTSGAYFTGLSQDTALTLTWRVAIEMLPAANKPQLLALSSPSAPFDPDVLKLYTLICTQIPPGVPQSYNDTGKWFGMISSVVKDVCPAAFPFVAAAQTAMNVVPQMYKGGQQIVNAAKQVLNMRKKPNNQQSTPRANNAGRQAKNSQRSARNQGNKNDRKNRR